MTNRQTVKAFQISETAWINDIAQQYMKSRREATAHFSCPKSLCPTVTGRWPFDEDGPWHILCFNTRGGYIVQQRTLDMISDADRKIKNYFWMMIPVAGLINFGILSITPANEFLILPAVFGVYGLGIWIGHIFFHQELYHSIKAFFPAVEFSSELRRALNSADRRIMKRRIFFSSIGKFGGFAAAEMLESIIGEMGQKFVELSAEQVAEIAADAHIRSLIDRREI